MDLNFTLFVLAHGAQGWADELLVFAGAAAIGVVAFLFMTRNDGGGPDEPES